MPGKSKDTQRLDFLEELRKKSGLTGEVLVGMDPRGRGFYLREALPFEKPAYGTVRKAVDQLMEAMGEA